MAITLNKHALRCLELAIARGNITSQSPPRCSIYDISRCWRELLDATGSANQDMPQWSEKEAAAAEVMVATLAYLHHIGCRNIEQLLRDTINLYSGRNP